MTLIEALYAMHHWIEESDPKGDVGITIEYETDNDFYRAYFTLQRELTSLTFGAVKGAPPVENLEGHASASFKAVGLNVRIVSKQRGFLYGRFVQPFYP